MNTRTDKSSMKVPSIWISLIPLLVLGLLLVLILKANSDDALSGGIQVALLVSTAVCIALSMGVYKTKWQVLEDAMVDNIKSSAVAIIILLMIGAISGTWMVSGVVPTMICYGLEILSPSWFLAACCIICGVVSLMTGSSWTTIATIGVALMGIGHALGFSEGWVAGAVISGAYFGDKFSPLSDTNVLATSTTEVPLFSHIKYMIYTTVPSLLIALAVFLVVSLTHPSSGSSDIHLYTSTLNASFNISPWLLIVPVFTGIMIYMRLNALITLFMAVVFAVIALIISQPELLPALAGEAGAEGFWPALRGTLTAVYGATSIDTGVAEVNDLVSTRGMAGMMDTIWLILCAMCFGGAMSGSRMLDSLTQLFLRFVRRTTSAVASTVGAGILFNMTTSDQYISIILSSRLFKGLYNELGLESRLLSRSVVDSATVTSVLVPWNSCGMVQSTVLGVATLAYLPYCVFNYVSPLITILVAAIGFKVYKRPKGETTGDMAVQ